jgi:glycerol-3-phosphate dehydrogenase (NAD(P)+)
MKVGVVGAGSWGTALAHLLSQKGLSVVLWAFEPQVSHSINTQRENLVYLPGVTLSSGIVATSELGEVVDGVDMLVNVVPTQHIRSVWSRLVERVFEVPVVSASKGIEVDTLKTADGIFLDLMGPTVLQRWACLSGPSFAREVARGLPAAVTVAALNPEVAQLVVEVFMTPRFRVYTHDDVIGVELGGALKNVIAIAAGICEGMGLGGSARASLITRGLAEISRLGVAMGAQFLTFLGLSGMGDLVLTCTGDLSRNRTVGVRIGKGERLHEIMWDMSMVAEGVHTSKAVMSLAERLKVDMPISAEVYEILYEGKDPFEALGELMERAPRPEFYWMPNKP